MVVSMRLGKCPMALSLWRTSPRTRHTQSTMQAPGRGARYLVLNDVVVSVSLSAGFPVFIEQTGLPAKAVDAQVA